MKPVIAVLLLATWSAGAQSERFYLGTHTDNPLSHGIYTGTLDAQTGRLGPVRLAAPAVSPNFLALSPDGKYLYAVTETNGGSVAAFQMKTDGRLDRLNELVAGHGVCHVSVDATGHNVFVANYSDGSIVDFHAGTNGVLEKRTAFVAFTGSGPNPARQTKPYAHATYTDAGNRHVYACDLGSDHVWVFDFDAERGTLTPANPPFARVSPGSGPRHLAFSPSQQFAYVNGEMGLNVTVFARDVTSGALTERQNLSTVPLNSESNGLATAEIFCHPNGKWLYVSNRDVAGKGRDSISVFKIDGDGLLERIQTLPANVKIPRGFNLDPSGCWLVACGQDDNRIRVFAIDPYNGKLTATDQTALVGAPMCVVFESPKSR